MALVLGVCFAGAAQSATIQCANPLVSGQDRQYQTTGASDCVWGNGNIGQGNPLNDEFLQGNGTNDAAYGNSGATFGLSWTLIDKQDYNGAFPAINGLTLSNVDGNSFDWTRTHTGYGAYALALIDGGDPKWSVFLLSDTSGVADIISGGGTWSHVALYGADDGGGTPSGLPEPGSMALVGLGLIAAAALRRRR